MRRTSSILCALAGLAACGDSAARLWAPPPPVSAGAATLLFVLEANPSPVLFASATEAGRPRETISFDLPADATRGTERLRVYEYRESLAELGLTPGLLRPGAGASCLLEQPVSAFVTEVPSPGAEWASAPAQLSAAARDALFGKQACTRPDQCVELVARPFDTGYRSQMRAMIPLEGGALLADGGSRLFVVTATGVTEREDLFGLPGQSLAPAADGQIWFGTQGGRLAKGPLDGPHTPLEIGTSTSAYVAAIADSEAHGLLVLTLEDVPGADDTQLVQLHLRRDEAWALLHRDTVHVSSWWESDIAWAPDGQALIVYGGFFVLRYDGEQVVPFDLTSIDLIEHIGASLLITEGGTAYVGARFGTLLAAEPPYETWDAVGAATVPTTIQALAAYRGGVAVGSTSGFVGQYYPNAPGCDGAVFHEANSHLLVAVGDALVVAGGGPRNVGAGVVTYLAPFE